MPLYPQSFIEEVRMQADIVAVVSDTVPLRRTGATYKGLCPFHGEKTPSFHVNRDRGFFHCFGCGVGGDVIKFVELRDRVGFAEAVRTLAQRFGLALPEVEGRDPSVEAERESLLRIHEAAVSYFREMLAESLGAQAREQLAARGVDPAVVDRLGLGFAPGYREGLKARLLKAGFPLALVVRSGLAVQRESGEVVDRFRNRLMIPISRESGSVVAFGGRAMLPDQQPKYLNSPETPIYVKGRTLYGLHLTKQAIRKAGLAVLVEGYFDFAMALQGGVDHVVATCGTALTVPQAQTLRRFANRVVLSFDPDAAGQGAAAKSSELLVTEGFDVRVAMLPTGEDPDTFVRRAGGEAYQRLVDAAPPYLDYLLERSAAAHDLSRSDGRQRFVTEMLAVAARIPEATARDAFADRLAHRARVGEEVVRAEIRKAAVARRTTLPEAAAAPAGKLKPAERDLLVGLLLDPERTLRAVVELEDEDTEGLASAAVLRMARDLAAEPAELVPGRLLERLNDRQAQALTGLAARVGAPAAPAECVRALRMLRYERERAAVQRRIDLLMEDGVPVAQLAPLLAEKHALDVRVDTMKG
ncbi:MAG: DNA primase [Vicinamibacterales bacterium]|nr:DNA primase [Vicinamibacterales bacterium]